LWFEYQRSNKLPMSVYSTTNFTAFASFATTPL
jgi:hypothetical protein